MIDPNKIGEVRDKFERHTTLWMVTTRPDGRPHTAPIWFVWHADRAYVMTGGAKLVNVRHNGFAALNTEDGKDVAILEGTARVIADNEPLFETVAALFLDRYEWDIRDSLNINQLIEIAPTKAIAWKA